MFRDLMSSGGRLTAFLLLSSILWVGVSTATSAAEGDNKALPYDVRIVVDISGSMKQTDPNDLRIPALNLLLELMPEGAQAGIWTFGRYVNNLVPVAKVDDVWRSQAKTSALKISSFGLQTNLSGALNDAAWGLSADSGFQQSIILLTDGKIDMAEAGAANAEQINTQERKKLMSQVLGKYRVAGANIHTLALSDLADKNLLQEIALETDGLYSEAQDAEALMKAFLRAFDQAIPAEQVPMEDNTFVIDGSVNEFTALIFKPSVGAQETALLTPGGERWTEMKHPASVRWHKDVSFDLITIKLPEAGTWIAEADLDPSNRVTILSDLALRIKGIPATIFPGDKLDVQINLTNEGDVVDSSEILRLTDITMKVVTASGREGSKVLSDPESPPADGIYREGLYRLKEMGQYQVDVVAEGRTFQRKRSFSMTMIQPVEITHRADTSKGVYRIEVRGLSDNLDIERSRVIAKIKSPDDNTIIQSVIFDEQAQAWVSEIEETKGPGQYRVDLNVRGVTQSGKNFKVKPESIVFDLPIPSENAESEVADKIVEGENNDAVESNDGNVVSENLNESADSSIDESAADDSAVVEDEPEEAVEESIVPKIDIDDVTKEEPVDESLTDNEREVAGEEEGLAWWVYLLIGLLNVAVIGAGVWWFMLRKSTLAVDAQTNIEAEGVIADLEDLED
ncbi:MAG: VWA domain-containing protein, partial [Oleispira antarctica]|nr:VWA domain-containing protein [Oleispira antarctica]MBQ0790983.1 VWA domain-containing protein [Oleispira antarctica]